MGESMEIEADKLDMAHGLLVALLAEHHGGEARLPLDKLPGLMGNEIGELWSYALDPVSEPGSVIVRVVRMVGRQGD